MRAIAQRYGAALAEAALGKREVESVRQDLAAMVTLVADSSELRNFLYSPAVSSTNKRAVAEQLVKRLGAGTLLRNFLSVLIGNQRTQLLSDIQGEFEAEISSRLGLAKARVTSARGLNDAEKTGLTKVLERLTGKQIEANYDQNPELLAGAIVRIGSTIYDGSVRGQLERLRDRLVSE
jgi:F-type H+-transporting ATPase subunit delta